MACTHVERDDGVNSPLWCTIRESIVRGVVSRSGAIMLVPPEVVIVGGLLDFTHLVPVKSTLVHSLK